MSKVELRGYTGAEYEYSFRQLCNVDEERIRTYCSSLRQRFASERTTAEAREQWIARTYISVKYVLSASLLLSSAEFATSKNLRIVEPYLLYYALFNCSRALFLMIPEQNWDDGGIVDNPTHSKVQNVVFDCLRHLSQDAAAQYGDINGRALAAREVFSYKFPAEGLKGRFGQMVPDVKEVITICQFIAETAEVHSECLQSAFRSLTPTELPTGSDALARFMRYEHRSLGVPITDNEDWYRLWQFTRHSDKPLSLHLTARPGLVEDFFGAWGCEIENHCGTYYDADTTDWRIIFDFA